MTNGSDCTNIERREPGCAYISTAVARYFIVVSPGVVGTLLTCTAALSSASCVSQYDAVAYLTGVIRCFVMKNALPTISTVRRKAAAVLHPRNRRSSESIMIANN